MTISDESEPAEANSAHSSTITPTASSRTSDAAKMW